MKLSPMMVEVLNLVKSNPDHIEAGRFGYIYKSAIRALVARRIFVQIGTHALSNGLGRQPVYKLVNQDDWIIK